MTMASDWLSHMHSGQYSDNEGMVETVEVVLLAGIPRERQERETQWGQGERKEFGAKRISDALHGETR